MTQRWRERLWGLTIFGAVTCAATPAPNERPPLPALTAPPTVSVLRYVPSASASAMLPMVPPPYTLGDVKALHQPGLVTAIELTIAKAGEPPRRLIERSEVLAVTDNGYRVRRTTTPKESKWAKRDGERDVTWGGVHQPEPWAAGTQVGEQTIEVRAGRFRCQIYHLVRPGREQTSYYAVEHPGLEVLSIQEDSDMTMRLELVEHRPATP